MLADLIEPEVALAVDEELFSILWDDTTCRIRQAGVYELAVNKHLLQVQQYTFQHLTHCDHCYSKPEFRENPIDRLQELRRLVWHHWFQNDPAVVLKNIDDENSTTYDHLDRICWYIDVNYRNIMLDLPDVYYRESRIAWIDLPDFGPFNTIELHDDDILAQPWLRNITTRGVEYYWNPDTGESSYERPKT